MKSKIRGSLLVKKLKQISEISLRISRTSAKRWISPQWKASMGNNHGLCPQVMRKPSLIITNWPSHDHPANLVAVEVVESQHRTQTDLLSPGIEVVAHAVPVAQGLAIGRGIFLGLEASGFLVQEEDVAVRRAARRGSRADVVGDKRGAGVEGGSLSDLHAGLDPVEDRTQNSPGGEGSIDIQVDDQVGLGGVQALEEDFRGRLGICVGYQ